MSRNKYPEITVENILEVSQRLFFEKGYDNTKIQDIADELGMTKGAIYHHFKSKEEIMNTLGDKLFTNNNPFEIVKKRTDLNGLEKMKYVINLNQSNEQMVELTNQALPLLENPQVLALSAVTSILARVDRGRTKGWLYKNRTTKRISRTTNINRLMDDSFTFSRKC